MQIYGPFRLSTTPNERGVGPSIQRPATPAARTTGPVDQLDLSAEAQALAAGEVAGPSPGGGEIRAERVAAIRRAIADGTYETPEKLDIALGRLLDDLG